MQDTMLMIYQSLKKSAAVTKKIAAIYNNPRAPDKDKNLFPRITMFEMLNNDSEYADDSSNNEYCYRAFGYLEQTE